MAERLKTTPPRPKAIPDKTSIPDLETVTSTMLQKFPGEKLPTAKGREALHRHPLNRNRRQPWDAQKL